MYHHVYFGPMLYYVHVHVLEKDTQHNLYYKTQQVLVNYVSNLEI